MFEAMAREPPHWPQIQRWRELGGQGRLELGCSLIDLGKELTPGDHGVKGGT